MSKIIINSWNMQGDGKFKANYLEDKLSKQEYNILLFQEEGVPNKSGYQKNDKFSIGEISFQCVLALTDPTAKNGRCTTAICVDEQLVKAMTDVNCHVEEVGRFLFYIDLGMGVRIATIHAIANDTQAVTQVKKYITWLNKNSPENGWILMGDFNSNPTRYPLDQEEIEPNISQTIRYGGTESRPEFCNIIYDAEPTQGKEGERTSYLDFAFHSTCDWLSDVKITNSIIKPKYREVLSDHNLIQLIINPENI